jgi:hypothetical protein
MLLSIMSHYFYIYIYIGMHGIGWCLYVYPQFRFFLVMSCMQSTWGAAKIGADLGLSRRVYMLCGGQDCKYVFVQWLCLYADCSVIIVSY